ncbi:hypothetical protein RB195_018310 [Necator americanus]|uniref:SUN domain-containing protein n=1 Tax=Necator americanus TaxID=51031 RepID=A0ABR1CAR4_NECAM
MILSDECIGAYEYDPEGRAMAPSLLVPSDDSDGGDCERRPPRRRFFQKSGRGSRKLLVDIGVPHCVLLCILFISIFFVAANTYSLSRRYSELSQSLSALSTMHSKMQTIELQLRKTRMEFDLWKENTQPQSNQTTNTTDYIYDVLEKLSTEIKEMKKKVAVSSSVTEEVTRRVSTVETRCLNVCRTPTMERDKPRRHLTERRRIHAGVLTSVKS